MRERERETERERERETDRESLVEMRPGDDENACARRTTETHGENKGNAWTLWSKIGKNR